MVRIRRLLHGARGVELPGESDVRGRGVRVVQNGRDPVAVAAGVVPGVEALAAFFGDCSLLTKHDISLIARTMIKINLPELRRGTEAA